MRVVNCSDEGQDCCSVALVQLMWKAMNYEYLENTVCNGIEEQDRSGDKLVPALLDGQPNYTLADFNVSGFQSNTGPATSYMYNKNTV